MLAISLVVLAVATIPIVRTLLSHDPLEYIYPNFLLFTNRRDEARAAWKERLHINTDVHVHHTHIPEIDGSKFSFETLRDATDNFRFPAVVRGLFSNTTAIEKWPQADYLPSILGDYRIPVVLKGKYGTAQDERAVMTFRESFTDVIENPDSQKYLFFPVKSRKSYEGFDEGSSERLASDLNNLVQRDLNLDRIWPGFGSDSHSTFRGSQLIVGRGKNSTEETTGTGWHCAPGNNYFVQVVGTKRWYFMDQKHSAKMSPLRGGIVNMMTGNPNMAALHPHLPLKYADIRAGDLLYNPDWEWHTIQNHEGLSIGCPIREVNMTLSARNNLQYTAITVINMVSDAMGYDWGGYHTTN